MIAVPGILGSSVQRWGHPGPSLGTYIAAVVNEACKVAALGGVDDGVVVYSEHVAATDAFILIPFLPHVRNHLVAEERALSLGLLRTPATCHPSPAPWAAPTWRMFWPTYSMTISSAAIGSMANRPQS